MDTPGFTELIGQNTIGLALWLLRFGNSLEQSTLMGLRQQSDMRS
jgi:hypothetical protein